MTYCIQKLLRETKVPSDPLSAVSNPVVIDSQRSLSSPIHGATNVRVFGTQISEGDPRPHQTRDHRDSTAGLTPARNGHRQARHRRSGGAMSAVLTAGHLGVRVQPQVGVQDGIADLIADLV